MLELGLNTFMRKKYFLGASMAVVFPFKNFYHKQVLFSIVLPEKISNLKWKEKLHQSYRIS